MMNPNVLADEMMAMLGGRRTKLRKYLFLRLATAIIRHIQVHGEVNVLTTGVSNGAGTAAGTGKVL